MTNGKERKGGRPPKVQKTEYHLSLVMVPFSPDAPGADYLLGLGSQMLSESGAAGWRIEKMLFLANTDIQMGLPGGEGTEGILAKVRPLLILWAK